MAEVEVKFGAATAGVEAGINRVREQIEGLTAPVQNVAEAFSKLGEAVVAGLAIEKLEHFVDSMAEFGEQTQHMAAQLGMGAEQVTRLGYAASVAGLSQDEMAHGLERLSYNMELAQKGGNQQAEAFQALGISQQFLVAHSNDMNAVLEKVADRFRDTADGPAKTAIAIAVFGRAGAELIPILDKGSEGLRELGLEADKAGVVLSGEMAEKLEHTKEEMVKLDQSFKGLSLTIGTAFLPAIDASIKATTEEVQEIGSWKAAWNEVGNTVIAAADFVIAAADIIGRAVALIKDAFEFVLKPVADMAANAMFALGDAMAGNFTTAANQLKQGWAEVGADTDRAVDNMRANIHALTDDLENMATLASGKMPGAIKPYPPAGFSPTGGPAAPKPPPGSIGGPAAAGQPDTAVIDAINEETRLRQQAAKQNQAIARIDAQGQIEIERSNLAEFKDLLAERVGAGQMTYDQMMTLVKDRTASEYQLELEELEKEWASTRGSPVQYERVYQQILALKQKFAQDMAAIDEQLKKHEEDAAKKTADDWRSALDPMTRAFEQMTQGILQGTQTWQAAVDRALSNMLVSYIGAFAKMATQFAAFQGAQAAGWTQMAGAINPFGQNAGGMNTLIAGLLGISIPEQAATDANTVAIATLTAAVAANTAALGSSAASGIAGMVGDSGGGGLGEALAGLVPAFASGTDYVPHNMLAFIHQGERIVTAGTNAEIAAGRASIGTGGMGGVAIHVSAMDGRSVRQFFLDNHEHVAAALKHAWRNGKAR